MIKDHINLELWENVLLKFADAIQLPVSTIDTKGNEIIAPQKLPYYCQLVRQQKSEICRNCRLKFLKKVKAEKKEILFYNCICGLMNIIVPIKVNTEIIGAVLCESIKQKENNVRLCQRVAKTIGIPAIELIDSINKMKVTEREEILQNGTLLHVLSKAIPTIAHDKVEDEKK
ncbi:PocR ligand-binding domain-containing protein [Candidatus Woesearchaeota archaeon]|nr:PocR ligand-binding domain-containing protein [Candidatus Woesearchaeota archaeon]